MFFDMSEMLCERYTGLTPFAVRREKVGEVFLLVMRINAKQQRALGVGAKKGETVTRRADGSIVIRREAQNDDWY